jgi:hypothetical protein
MFLLRFPIIFFVQLDDLMYLIRVGWRISTSLIIKTAMLVRTSWRRNSLAIRSRHTVQRVITLHKVHRINRVANVVPWNSFFSILASNVIQLVEVVWTVNNRVSCIVITRDTCAFLLGVEVVISVLGIVTRTTTISLIIVLWTKGAESTCASGILCPLMSIATRLIDQATWAKDLSTKTAGLSIGNILVIQRAHYHIFVIWVWTIYLLLLLLNCRL